LVGRYTVTAKGRFKIHVLLHLTVFFSVVCVGFCSSFEILQTVCWEFYRIGKRLDQSSGTVAIHGVHLSGEWAERAVRGDIQQVIGWYVVQQRQRLYQMSRTGLLNGNRLCGEWVDSASVL